MKLNKTTPHHYSSLSELHRMLGLPMPVHPLVSLVNNSENQLNAAHIPDLHTSAFYKIALKQNLSGKLKYGQQYYDFDQGGLFFISPNQLTANSDNNGDHSGYTLIIHPDFLQTYPLARSIRQYGFFSYTANEALHLAVNEKETILAIFKNIEQELQSRLDDFSQDVMISQIETLLNYSKRFYKRQFLTRKKINTDLLQKLEAILDEYFNLQKPLTNGIPTVQYLAGALNLSPGYLGDMLRHLTGRSAQQQIQDRLIEKAKERLSTTELSIGEIAYELGFEHSQSFSRLFKAKTKLSPLAFRAGFH